MLEQQRLEDQPRTGSWRFLFDPAVGCAHGFPTHRHRKSRYDDPTAALLFCKNFELT